MSVGKISRRTLADDVRTSIREAILSGQFKSGDPLYEVDLSELFGVSRAPIREALLHLTGEGLVTMNRSRIRTVTTLSPTDIAELATLRTALECLAWERTCSRIDASGIARLEALIERMRQAVSSAHYPELVHLDIAFHDIGFQLADHLRLYNSWQAIKWQVALYLLNSRVSAPDYHSIIVDDHRGVVDKLKSGDHTRMSDIISDHILLAYQRLMGLRNGAEQVTLEAGAPTEAS